MNPTIKDVARAAKVSIATVSRVLNNLSGYSEETRRRVYDAIEQLDYQPNAIARGLINKRTRTLGVLVPSVSSAFSAAILRGIEDTAHAQGYSVVVCNTHSEDRRTLEYLQVLAEKQADGLILASDPLKDEIHAMTRRMRIPLVLVSSLSPTPEVPHVRVDDYRAAYDAVSYLIEKGHRRILMLSGSVEDRIAGLPRIEGYRDALQEHGLPFRSEDVVRGDFLFRSGYDAMEAVLAERRPPEFTAVFAASDEMALAVMAAAGKQGLRIPDDLSVMGYDDTQLATMVYPPLTTVRQPLYEFGCRACDKLLRMIQTGDAEASETLGHSIAERLTVKPLSE
ncbi:LacI family DNA-binding transcriptional regulator [Gorillibacterium sp. sgz500922]|uniref:LacI family DNA-binding transcriptional regulator n=1 Tax=Gorillibacterium sp. sgz500922 TaxID=3446694 RepID=UPI003F67CC50